MMPAPFLFAAVSVAATMAGSLLLFYRREWIKANLRRFLSFGAGILLGAMFLHLLPEAWELDKRAGGVGVLAAFILFYVAEHFTVLHPCGHGGEMCDRGSLSLHTLTALSLHGLADGLTMAVAFLSSSALGTVVSVAVVVHKFSDGMTLTGLLLDGGETRRRTMAVSLLLALATPLGVAAGWVVGPWLGPALVSLLLGLAGGSFLYVSTADVLPRLHKCHDIFCWVFMAAGMLISALLPHQ